MPKSSIPALIPLSLLEAIRNLDTPVEDGLDELAEEIVVRRLGLSPTVAAQIQRYRQAADRGGSVELDVSDGRTRFTLVLPAFSGGLPFSPENERLEEPSLQ